MIDKSLFQQKFRALEPLGKLLTDGLLDDSWAGKTDKRPWFRKDDISLHGKTRGDAARCRVCKHSEIKQPCIAVPLDSRAGFGHLHQG